MDEPLPSLDDLLREIREVPSPEVRLAGLAVTRKVIEQQLDFARHLELTKLRQQHIEDQTHEDDAALDLYELEVQVTHLLPKVLRGGFLLALWSTLEACTKDLAVYASRQTGRALPNGLFRHGSFVESSERAFASVLNIKAYETFDERNALARLARVRAAWSTTMAMSRHCQKTFETATCLRLSQRVSISNKTFIIDTSFPPGTMSNAISSSSTVTCADFPLGYGKRCAPSRAATSSHSIEYQFGPNQVIPI
jgi:hypothetical protein